MEQVSRTVCSVSVEEERNVCGPNKTIYTRQVLGLNTEMATLTLASRQAAKEAAKVSSEEARGVECRIIGSEYYSAV